MEAWYTKEKGPMLIECNPRVGGGPIQVLLHEQGCTGPRDLNSW